jgi:hypothetical protein
VPFEHVILPIFRLDWFIIAVIATMMNTLFIRKTLIFYSFDKLLNIKSSTMSHVETDRWFMAALIKL